MSPTMNTHLVEMSYLPALLGSRCRACLPQMTPSFARPGQGGLSCGKCGDAMLVTSHDGRLKPEIWFCQRCEQAWSVPAVSVVHAVRVKR